MREENRNIWGRLGCATKKKRSTPASQCAVTDKNGQQQVITGQEPFQRAVANAVDYHFQRAIANAVDHRFHGATDAPINSGQLLQDLGTIADTECAAALLRGDYNFPEECEEATKCIFHELVPLLTRQQSPMNVQLKNSDFLWWRTAPEKTESSRSTVGFNHMIAQSFSDKLTTLQIKKMNLMLRLGLPLERWLNGILLLLQKEIGNIDIDKLRFIILFEADFNFLLKKIFAQQLMACAIENDTLPIEFYAMKGKKAKDAIITRTL